MQTDGVLNDINRALIREKDDLQSQVCNLQNQVRDLTKDLEILQRFGKQICDATDIATWSCDPLRKLEIDLAKKDLLEKTAAFTQGVQS